MNLHFVDDNADMANALQIAFKDRREVEVVNGDLISLARNCIVSPANSQGFMDGGIDRALVDFFGASLEGRVREAILRLPDGRLPLGSGMAVNTGNLFIPWLLIAPTMESPEMVEPINAYRAMRAILRLASKHETLGRDLFCPGLCTGVGAVLPSDAAKEMARAYEDWARQQA